MRKISLLIVAIIAFSAFAGCELMDNMFFWAAPVKASDLGSFSGSAASTDQEVLGTALYGTMSNIPEGAISPQVRKLIATFAPGFAKMSASITGKSISETGTMAFDENGDLDYSVTFKNESFGVTGLDATGKAKIVIDVTEGSTVSTIKAEASGEIAATMGEMADTPFNGAIVNAKAKGNGDVSVNMDTGDMTVKGYTAIAINAGFSIDEIGLDTDDDGIVDTTYKGGKFLVSYRFIESVDYDSQDIAELEQDPSSIDMEVNVKVYDNNNKLVHEKTFTASDVVGSI